MPTPRFLALATAAIVAVAGIGAIAATRTLPGVSDRPAAGPDDPRQLRPVAAFGSIGDTAARSVALFAEAAKVITDPRCMNCHPATREPTQGDDMRPHVPFMQAGLGGVGVDGLACGTCHRAENTTLVGSRIRSVPGNAHWSLAPASMGWQGLSVGEICRQLKDPDRNGGRTMAQVVKHMAEDHLVGWAWHPGEGRRPAPGTHEAFGELVAAWVDTGAHCPP